MYGDAEDVAGRSSETANAPLESHCRRRDLAAADAERPLARGLHARDARGPRSPRRLLAPSVPRDAGRTAERLRPRRLQVLQGPADARQSARAAERGSAGLRAEADLAHRVRLSDEPARSLRRLPVRAGQVRRPGGPAGEERTVRRRADSLRRQGRTAALRLAERALLGRRRRQALVQLVHAPDRPVRPTRTSVFGSYTRVIRARQGTRLRVLYLPGGPASAEKVSTRPIVVH